MKDKPKSGPAIRPAKNAPVPGVESQEISNSAGSAYSLGTTGGVRITCMCSPGTGCFHETRSSTLVTDGIPHSTTRTASRRNGDQASRILPAPRLSADFLGGGASPSIRHTLAGCHTLPKKNASTSSVPMPPRISTSDEPMKFDQKNWMDANVTPHTTRPGQTARTSRVLHMIRISQNGRIRTTMGRMRPIIALKSASGRPVTATSVRTGLPKPP